MNDVAIHANASLIEHTHHALVAISGEVQVLNETFAELGQVIDNCLRP